MSIVSQPSTIQPVVEQLVARLGNEGEAAALLAVFIAAWQQAATELERCQAKHDVTVGGAASFLIGMSTGLEAYRAKVAGADAQLAALHAQIIGKLKDAQDNSAKAESAMKDVLQVYVDFKGSTAQLKGSLGSLAKVALVAMNPAVGAFAAPLIDRVLG